MKCQITETPATSHFFRYICLVSSLQDPTQSISKYSNIQVHDMTSSGDYKSILYDFWIPREKKYIYNLLNYTINLILICGGLPSILLNILISVFNEISRSIYIIRSFRLYRFWYILLVNSVRTYIITNWNLNESFSSSSDGGLRIKFLISRVL